MRVLLAALVVGVVPHGLVAAWTTVAETTPNALERWTFQIYPDGRYDFSLGKHTLVFDDGSLTAKGSRLTFAERKARGEKCAGAARVGTYTFRLSGRTLTLTAVKDRCSWRRTILTAKPLTRG